MIKNNFYSQENKGGVKADTTSELKLPLLIFFVFLITSLLTIQVSSLNQVNINSATQPIAEKQIFKQGDIIDLKVQCINNGTFCLSGNCFMTLLYPNNTMLLNNVILTNKNSTYNYTLTSTQTLGDYSGAVTCCDSTNCATNNFPIKITTTGNDSWFVIPLFLMLGAFILFGFASYLKNEYIGLVSGFLFIIAGMYMMIYGLGIFQDTYTRAIAFITLGIGLMVCFIAVVEMFYTDLGIMNNGEDD